MPSIRNNIYGLHHKFTLRDAEHIQRQLKTKRYTVEELASFYNVSEIAIKKANLIHRTNIRRKRK